ncbi:MAG: response regulator, partial [Planctomycetes bacterium]|nr:response regulator [Planctomycetota bacterium]
MIDLSSNQRILLIDDDSSVLQSLKRQFRKKDWDISICSNGQDAIDNISHNTYAVILSDVCMPHITGIEVLSHALKHSPHSARVLLSGLSTLNDAIEAINTCKADQFFLKPCDPSILTEAIEKHLTTYNLQDENRKLQEKINEQNGKLRNLNKKLLTDLENKHRIMLTSWSIQNKLLIDPAPTEITQCQICCYSIPAQELNGDFVLFHKFNKHCFDLVVGDVMGKGISAALQG